MAHHNLGAALGGQGKADEAIAEYREVIRLRPDDANAHCTLGHFLKDLGRFAESLAAFRRGHELGIRQPGWRSPSADWVRRAEELAALEERFSAFLKGESRPRDAEERLRLADICRARRLNHAGARFLAEAFAADPALADDLKATSRYYAACLAALAAAGRGVDAARLDDAERTRLRRQALDWLRADLARWSKGLDGGPAADRAEARRMLRHWQQDSDLAPIRDPDGLATLDQAERKECEALWRDVEALLRVREGIGQKIPH